MSDKSNQQISNLMDGELDVNASRFLLKRMAADESLSQKWNSYHLIKSCLQKQQSEPLVVDVATQVIMRLGKQTVQTKIVEPKINRWLKPVMGIGIAASVAFMSVVMLKNQQVDGVDAVTPEYPIIVQENVAKPIETNIVANVATASRAIVPPPSLSRFPSVSAKDSNNYNQGLSHNMNVPYLIIINQSKQQTKQYSPMLIKDISD